jgi:hypothetical protein
MLSLLAALLAAQPAPLAPVTTIRGTAWVFATVGGSEWCPAGNVRLDLRTGHYSHVPTAPRRICGQPGIERPVRVGNLRGEQLEAARSAWRRAQSEGLGRPACRDGRRSDVIVVDNGPRQILLLTSGAESRSAPEDRSCWSEAAAAFHEQLRRIFETAAPR